MQGGPFAIDRVPGDISPEAFDRRYYLPQQPVIISDIARNWRALQRWTPQYLRSELATQAKPNIWWFELSEGALAEDYVMPPFIARHWDRAAPQQRRIRVWLSRAGTVTPWHYDGHCPQIINVQISGSKKFTLVSPETPLPCVPFWFESHLEALPPEQALSPRSRYTTFELRAGDGVFIPMHWAHYVESVDAENVGFNWFWVDVDRFRDSTAAATVREKEALLAMYYFQQVFDPLRRRISIGREYYKQPYAAMVHYLANFAMAPRYEVVKELRGSISAGRLLRRVALESLHVVPALRAYRRRKLREEAQFGAQRNANTFFESER